MDPKQPEVFITGADRGLGQSLVARFLREGWRVFAGIYTNAANLQNLEQEHGPRLACVPLDVTDPGSVAAAGRQVAEQTPALDVLVNNAAVYLPPKPVRQLAELDLEDGHLEATMAVNAFGPLRVTRQFQPLLDKGKLKLIVNISSEAGSIANCWRTSEFAYSMSKAALNMQTRILHNDLGPRGFRVLAVHPGWMRTDMGGAEADIHPDESAEGIFALCLKAGQPDDSIYVDYRGNPLEW